MKRLAMVLLSLMLGLPACALAGDGAVSSTDLIEDAKALDGQTVVYVGEVIGDVLPRGDHTWLNISDGTNAIGVWVEAQALEPVPTPGRYGQQGDTVRVTGVFYRACREHGGDMDIHAITVELVAKGNARDIGVSGWRLVLAIALTCVDVTAGLWWLATRRRAVR